MPEAATPKLHADNATISSWLPGLLRGQWEWLSMEGAKAASDLSFSGIERTFDLRRATVIPTDSFACCASLQK